MARHAAPLMKRCTWSVHGWGISMNKQDFAGGLGGCKCEAWDAGRLGAVGGNMHQDIHLHIICSFKAHHVCTISRTSGRDGTGDAGLLDPLSPIVLWSTPLAHDPRAKCAPGDPSSFKEQIAGCAQQAAVSLMIPNTPEWSLTLINSPLCITAIAGVKTSAVALQTALNLAVLQIKPRSGCFIDRLAEPKPILALQTAGLKSCCEHRVHGNAKPVSCKHCSSKHVILPRAYACSLRPRRVGQTATAAAHLQLLQQQQQLPIVRRVFPGQKRSTSYSYRAWPSSARETGATLRARSS
eukprot:scaffold27881_cov18-Tisochrysis_lutea.AAC.2